MNNERLILGVALLDEGQPRGIEARLAGLDAAAVIEHQSQAHKNVFMLEDRNGLIDVVLRHPEVFLLKTPKGAALQICHGHMQFHQIDVHRKGSRRPQIFRRRRQRILGQTLYSQKNNNKNT